MVKKKIGNLLDIGLILSVVVYFYFHAYIDSRGAVGEDARWIWFRGALLIIALILFPFRVKRYPSIAKFVNYNRQGTRRANFIIPALCLAGFIFSVVFLIRVIHVAIGVTMHH